VAALLGLQVPAQELFDQTEPLLQERCGLCRETLYSSMQSSLTGSM
jgi:hypothetical protein